MFNKFSFFFLCYAATRRTVMAEDKAKGSEENIPTVNFYDDVQIMQRDLILESKAANTRINC